MSRFVRRSWNKLRRSSSGTTATIVDPHEKRELHPYLCNEILKRREQVRAEVIAKLEQQQPK